MPRLILLHAGSKAQIKFNIIIIVIGFVTQLLILFYFRLQVGYGDDDPLVYRLALITYDDDVSIHLHLNAGGDYANISNAFFTHMSGGPDGPG